MDRCEVRRHCRRLRELFETGPGADSEALSKALCIAALLQSSGPSHLVVPLGSLTPQLREWFTRKAPSRAGREAWQLRDGFLQDLFVIENRWDKRLANMDH
jgi:hypothetical protein